MDKYQDLQELIATSELGFAGTRHIDACLGETNPVSDLTAALGPQRRQRREIGTELRGAPLHLGSGQEYERNHASERTSAKHGACKCSIGFFLRVEWDFWITRQPLEVIHAFLIRNR